LRIIIYNNKVKQVTMMSQPQQDSLFVGESWKEPKVVLFDMDGVLYDSMPNHGIAWQRAMKEFGIHFTLEDSYATEGARGVDTIRKYSKAQLGKELSEDEAQRIYNVKAHYFHEMPEAKVFDGVIDLMRKIKESGLKIGIVTGSAQLPLIERVTRDFGEFVSKDQITTAYDVKRGKPNPDPYLMGLQKAGNYSPSEGIVVENAPLGVHAGVAAGCYTVAINSGPLADSVLLKEGANILFPTIRKFADSWEHVLERLTKC
jgi:HAD hydrolase, family IA, variant 3